MTFKEWKTPNAKKGSNFFISMYVLLCKPYTVKPPYNVIYGER